MKKFRLDRRTFLRGAGTVAIGLPFLEEMLGSAAVAETNRVPCRLVTAFFGLGLDPSWQQDFGGPLEPYRSLANKMAMCSANMGQGNSGGAHCNTATVVFVGEQQRSTEVAGGASIDQIMRRELDPTSPVLASGIFWRRGACDAQANRVYRADGSPRPPIKRPSQVFDSLFGSFVPPSGGTTSPGAPTEAERRELRIKRSVFDGVLEQYRRFTGSASPLGRESRLKIEEHVSSLREIEASLAPADQIIDQGDGMGNASCSAPSQPSDPPIADYDRFTYGTGSGAPAIDWQDFERVFRLHADLWVAALRCDLVRYGNLMFESAGGHTNFQGTYQALGSSTNFPGNSQHDSYFHDNQREHARLTQHLAQRNIAYFLSQLDDNNHLESNGKTVLDNSCVVVGTEYGWNHSKNNAFHAVAGGGGRFRSGFFTDRRINCTDLYNAVLSGYGIDARIGERSGVASEGDASFLLA